MSEEREFEGKDLEEALASAAAALGIPQAELHYEMLEAGRRGVLGLGVRNVRIRVKPPLEVELPAGDPETRPFWWRARRGRRRNSIGNPDTTTWRQS